MYRRLGEAQPKNVRSFYSAAAALNKRKQHKLAQEMLTKGEHARASNGQRSQDTWRLMELGSICFDGELFDTAIQLIRAAIANERESGRKPEPMIQAAMANLRGLRGKSELMLSLMLAEAHFDAKRYAEAVEAYRQIVNASKHDTMKKIAEEGMHKAQSEGNLSD